MKKGDGKVLVSSFSQNITMTFTNTSFGAVTGSLSTGASAGAETVTAVPEPADAALLLPGRGVVGLIARRRRAGRNSPR